MCLSIYHLRLIIILTQEINLFNTFLIKSPSGISATLYSNGAFILLLGILTVPLIFKFL